MYNLIKKYNLANLVFILLLTTSNNSFSQDTQSSGTNSFLSEEENNKNPKGYSVPVVLTTKNMASISSEISGTVKKILVHAGDYFVKDDTLVVFDCTLLDASLKKSTAELAFANNKHAAISRLDKLDGASKIELETSTNELAKAQAEFDIAKYNADQCTLKAPFAGQMVEVYVKEFETIKAGTKLYDIVDNSNFEIAMIVPSEWLKWLKKGDSFKLAIKENNRTYTGNIASIIYSVDAVSQSVKLIGKITEDTSGLFVGASGTATFEGLVNGRAK